MVSRQDYDALKRRLDAANGEISRLLKENDSVKKMNEVLAAEKTQWVQQKAMQEQVIQSSLNQSNEKNNSMLQQIQSLNDEINRLKRERDD